MELIVNFYTRQRLALFCSTMGIIYDYNGNGNNNITW